MLTSQSQQQQESLNTTDKQELKYEKWEIDDTPFTIIQEPNEFDTSEAMYHLTIGNKLLETFRTYKEAEKSAQKITWNRLLAVILITLETQKQIDQLKN